jgi:[protein-PII] uridylyltransferase
MRIAWKRRRAAARAAVLGDLPVGVTAEEVEAHCAQMPPRYWEDVTAGGLAWHLSALHGFYGSLARGKREATAPFLAWRHDRAAGASDLAVVTWDRHALFSRIAGSLALAGLNVLSADVHTRGDHVVLDLFRVCTPTQRAALEAGRRTTAARALARSLRAGGDEFPFAAMIRRKRLSAPGGGGARLFATEIEFDQGAARGATVLRVRTPDYLGLLYDLSETLALMGLEITQARAGTRRAAAVDEFTISEKKTGRISDPHRLAGVRAALLKRLGSAHARL